MKSVLAPPIQLGGYIVFKCELKISSCLYTNITSAGEHNIACQVVFCVLASSLSEWKTIKSSFSMHDFCSLLSRFFVKERTGESRKCKF